jgi:hypothetical protein
LLGLGENQIRQIGEAARAQAAQFDVKTVAQRYLEDFAGLRQNNA